MAKASKRLSPLIASVESISFIGFSDDSDNMIVPLFLWKKLASFETRPSSKVKDKSSTEELNDWLMDSLKKANIGKECYLSIGEFGELPWTKVQVCGSNDWIRLLWDQLETHEFIILASNKNSYLGLIEDEDHYEAHIGQISE